MQLHAGALQHASDRTGVPHAAGWTRDVGRIEARGDHARIESAAPIELEDLRRDLVVDEHGPTEHDTASSSGGEGVPGPLPDESTLELSEDRCHRLHGFSLRRGGLRGIQGEQLPSTAARAVHKAGVVAQGPRQPVQLGNDQDAVKGGSAVRFDIGQRVLEAGPR